MNKIIYRIGEISQIFSGGDRPKVCSDVRTAECSIPIFSNGLDEDGLYGYTNKAQIEGDCITVSARGANIGVVFYRDEPFLPIVRLLSIVPDRNKIDSKYLYYYFKTDKIIGTGSAQPQLTIPFFQKKKIFVYENLATQQKIAHILSRYDEAIENNNKRIKLLEQMAQNLYKEWFVRFRFPGYENCEFENGIPVGWKYKNLFDVVNVTYGYAFTSELFCDDESLNPVVRIRDILDNYTKTFTSEECSDKYIIKENEILIGMDGIFHMCMWNGGKAYQNQRVVKLTAKTEVYSNYFLFLAVQPQIKFWEQTIAGTTVAHLGDKHLKRINVLIPSDDILKQATIKFNLLMKQKNSLFKANKNLVKQRDLLLPRLMSGKIEV